MVSAIDGLRAVTAFLTKIPVGPLQDGLEKAATWMPLFPAVGLFVGTIAALSRLLFALFLPPLVSAVLALGVLLAVTGLHHTDGLLDFGDGLMCTGTREEKIAAMRDTATGAGGFAMGIVILLTTTFAIASLGTGLQSVLILASAEASAKASMVLASSFGRSASPGMNSLFIEKMHGRHRVLGLTFAIAFATLAGLAAFGLRGVLSVAIASLVALVVSRVSNAHFGGLTGDVFGAINDIARTVSLLVAVAS